MAKTGWDDDIPPSKSSTGWMMDDVRRRMLFEIARLIDQDFSTLPHEIRNQVLHEVLTIPSSLRWAQETQDKIISRGIPTTTCRCATSAPEIATVIPLFALQCCALASSSATKAFRFSTQTPLKWTCTSTSLRTASISWL